MGLAKIDESRREHRRRVLKGGTILLGISQSEIKCMIRNMHETGAELKLSSEARLPQEFLLYVAVDGVAYRCQVMWRAGDRAGISISGTEEKPAWHYG